MQKTTPPQFTPPPFSQKINSIFPNTPFLTCLQAQFEPPSQSPAPPSAHFWFIKAEATGQLTIDVRAVIVNPGEAGSINALLFNVAPPGPPIAQVKVSHPTGLGVNPSDENIGFMTIGANAGTIYRLDVLLGPPPITDPPTPQAHHYKLSFSGVPVDVGINSPTYRYFEPNLPHEVFQVNVDQGENFILQILTESSNQGAKQATQVTIEIRDRNNLSNPPLFKVTNQLLSLGMPFNVNIPKVNAGTLALFITADFHYRIAKITGSDQGIYFDACPPPP